MPDADVRRPHGGSGDVLFKAREMGMKIWALEKLQRMMMTMFETNTGSQPQHGHNTRSNTGHVSVGASRLSREADLSQLLRNERFNGPSDRDRTVVAKETVLFRGPHIYVRDLDDKQRPIMVREYAKVAHREDGAWPQFRSVSNGKCPFVEEAIHSKRDGDRERARKDVTGKREIKRAVAHAATAKDPRPADAAADPRVLAEKENAANRGPAAGSLAPKSKLFDPPARVITAKDPRPDESFRQPSHQHVGKGRPASHFFGGEPIASGLQQSNVTSAIRSQMISSTAAAPGAKAGTSKEVYELKRKVLEKNSAPILSGMSASYKAGNSAAAAAKNDRIGANFRAAKRKAQEKLGFIDEDFTPSEEEENARQVGAIEKARASRYRMLQKRDPKPGYCENCRDKCDDFDEVCCLLELCWSSC